MTSRLNPYLSFRDNAREAMEFYQSVFGGELDLQTFGELQGSADESEKDKIMHAMLSTPSGFVLMGADTPASMDYTAGTNFAVSLSGDDEPELRGYYDKLIVGGTVLEPLVQAPWGDLFGMAVDKFGFTWMVNVSAPEE